MDKKKFRVNDVLNQWQEGIIINNDRKDSLFIDLQDENEYEDLIRRSAALIMVTYGKNDSSYIINEIQDNTQRNKKNNTRSPK